MARFSNQLHAFQDNSPAAKPTIDKIIELRNIWKQHRISIETYEKTGAFSSESDKPNQPIQGAAEIKLDITNTQAAIRKQNHKLKHQPEHPNAPAWKHNLAMLEAHLEELKVALIRLSYEKQ